MYRPDLDQALKELKFERFDGRECKLSRKETFLAGAEFERNRILEALWKNGEKVLTLEEVAKIVNMVE